ncbi:MAG: folylpolyglutamate synthase/dihydrofolate synthase family protein [Pseudomonadota bacterium]
MTAMSLATERALSRLSARHPLKIDLSLGRIRDLLKKLGDPHKHMPPTFHVAGTNGKGSTVAFLRAILEAAGLRPHVYTSPHLVRFHERIRVAGTLISDEQLCGCLDDVERALGDDPITFFEATTTAAFLAFRETPADALILEVGLGGEFDTTNVIPVAAASGIAQIALDHAEFLGTDLAGIASTKARIAKPGAPMFAQWQPNPSVRAAISAEAKSAGTRVRWEGRDFGLAARADQSWYYRDKTGGIELPPLGLFGAHQEHNAALAIAMIRGQKALSVEGERQKQAIQQGVAEARWPARLQRLPAQKLAPGLHQESEIWLDGGHNAGAAEVIASFLRSKPAPLTLVVAIQANKDVTAFLAPFADLKPHIVAVPLPGGKGATPAEIASAGVMLGLTTVQAADAVTALDTQIFNKTSDPQTIVICGSLYLAGFILEHFGFAAE